MFSSAFRKISKNAFVLVITFLRGKFPINLPTEKEGDFKISKNERDKFFPNFTNKHVILTSSHVTSSQRDHKGKNYTQKNQSISTNLINITP